MTHFPTAGPSTVSVAVMPQHGHFIVALRVSCLQDEDTARACANVVAEQLKRELNASAFSDRMVIAAIDSGTPTPGFDAIAMIASDTSDGAELIGAMIAEFVEKRMVSPTLH
jgi:hypothetical protein